MLFDVPPVQKRFTTAVPLYLRAVAVSVITPSVGLAGNAPHLIGDENEPRGAGGAQAVA